MASPNDRLREVAYGYFERTPAPSLAPRLLAALDKEEGDFVRPALVRALAAMHEGPKVREALLRDARRGVDFFRSTVIEALGDYKVAAAMPKLTEIAKLDGPLQDDAATALGKIGDKAALGTLAEIAAHGAEGSAAGGGRRHLPARHQLLVAHRLPREDAGLCRDYPGYQDLLAAPPPAWAPSPARATPRRCGSCSTSASRRRIRCARRWRWRSAWSRCATRR